MISLRPLTDANREAVLCLRVSPAQEQFVSSVEESLLEAAEEPGGRAIFWAVYDGETPVGFVMISDEVDGPGLHRPLPLEAARRRAPPAPRLRHGGARSDR